MTSDSAPDAISSDQLRSFLKDSADGPGLVGSRVPSLPLERPDAGLADLLLANQQLLRASNGASPLQLLHAGCYIFSVAVEVLDRQIAQVSGEPTSVGDMIILTSTRHVIASIKSCVAAVEAFLQPLTSIHLAQCGLPHGSRKGLISDGALQALGIDIAAYDADFRHSASSKD